MKNVIPISSVPAIMNGVTNSIQKAGYFAPANDTGDVRSIQAWDVLKAFYEKNENMSVTYLGQFDYSQMASTNHPRISYYQCRENSDLSERKAENREKFFGPNKQKLKKLPWIFKDKDGDYLTPIGNGRSYTFKDEKWVGPCIMIDVSEIAEKEYLSLARELSRLSNISNDHTTKPEGESDWEKQLKTDREHEEEFYPSRCASWNEAAWESWGHKQLKKIPDLNSDNKQSVRTRVIRKAFDIGYGASLDFPTNLEIQAQYSKFKPSSVWNPEGATKVFQHPYSSNWSGLKSVIISHWENNGMPNKYRKHVELAIRIGERKQDKQSKESVVSGRTAFIETVKATNKHHQWAYAGMPIITKILFVNQIEGLDDAELWEWDFNTEEFVPCSKIC
jgi:hypothetical protein